MTWITWRQFRTQTWITLGCLAAVAIVLAISGHDLADLWTSSGAAACHSHCGTATNSFLTRVGRSFNHKIFNLSTAVLYVVPGLIGIFWGAPLIARELEAGTHRLAFNQSVTRTRWLVAKLTIVGGAAAVTVGLLSWAVSAWAHHIDRANANRIGPMLFGARGIVPIGYVLFAFALGVTLGMLIRRTVPAMAATLTVYVAAVVSMPLWIRAHLVPTRHLMIALDVSKLRGIGVSTGDGRMQVEGGATPANSWVLTNTTITPTGHVFTGPANLQLCGPDVGTHACENWVGSLGLRQNIIYQPGSHFWSLQWAETGTFVVASGLLIGFCFWWIRRRLV